MKNMLLIGSFTMILLSCTSILFEDPQPLGAKSLNSFPVELRGSFSFIVLNQKTTVEVGEDFISNKDGKAFLSDSLVVKKLGNRYVVNMISSKGEKAGKWEIFILEDKGCGFVKGITYVINSDSYLETFQAQYDGTVVGHGQEKFIVVKPTADQFNAIIKDDSVNLSVIMERLE